MTFLFWRERDGMGEESYFSLKMQYVEDLDRMKQET